MIPSLKKEKFFQNFPNAEFLMIIEVDRDIDFFSIAKLVKLIPNMHITTTFTKAWCGEFFSLVDLSRNLFSIKASHLKKFKFFSHMIVRRKEFRCVWRLLNLCFSLFLLHRLFLNFKFIEWTSSFKWNDLKQKFDFFQKWKEEKIQKNFFTHPTIAQLRLLLRIVLHGACVAFFSFLLPKSLKTEMA